MVQAKIATIFLFHWNNT